MKRPIQVTSLLLAGLATAAAARQVVAPTAEPQNAPAPAPAPTPPPRDDLRFIRMKISAGDLASAESILEVHRAEKGEDGEYLLGLAWLARGALLVGDWPAASRYAKATRAMALSRLGTPAVWENNSEAQYALGTSIEVEAQVLVHEGKKLDALALLDSNSTKLETAPYNLRARIWKRRNQIELVGRKAPSIRPEEVVGPAYGGLDALRGKPVVVYLWWEACGDCRMQSAALRRTVEKYAPRGVAFVAPTRYYREGAERSAEKEKIEKSWKETYGLEDTVAVPISDEAMLRYGVSATPTFVFIDRGGVVRQYLPYRMTEERMAAEIEELLKM